MAHYYIDAELAKLFASPRFEGFTGATCHSCGKTANVQAGGAGWLCACHRYNVLHLDRLDTDPHEHPGLGPTRARILAAAEGANRVAERG